MLCFYQVHIYFDYLLINYGNVFEWNKLVIVYKYTIKFEFFLLFHPPPKKSSKYAPA